VVVGLGQVLGTCLRCYEGLEECLHSGQCPDTDDKFIPMDRLRRLILRDCPIKNAGPCPKTRSSAASTNPCVCPKLEDLVITSTTVVTSTTTTPSSPVEDKCASQLEACKKSLTFTSTTKEGAQNSRSNLAGEVDRLLGELDSMNVTKQQFENKSKLLSDEFRECGKELSQMEEVNKGLREGWEATNATLLSREADVSNLTSLWTDCLSDKAESESLTDDLRVNLTICEGDLQTKTSSDDTCRGITAKLQTANAGNQKRICVYFTSKGDNQLLLNFCS
jgi:hypothetical protein